MTTIYVVLIENLTSNEVDSIKTYSTKENAIKGLQTAFDAEISFLKKYCRDWKIETDKHPEWYQVDGIDYGGHCQSSEYGCIEECVLDDDID